MITSPVSSLSWSIRVAGSIELPDLFEMNRVRCRRKGAIRCLLVGRRKSASDDHLFFFFSFHSRQQVMVGDTGHVDEPRQSARPSTCALPPWLR